ncbi:MAG TPA: FliM/FliN family flagellar motor C-terminal domain-containing protein [Candidatus Eremiobacteraceae bacterium]|nr:FliM/FliN family flagellar motor C-terminal domain-containing protein [Candidatus Eremiobacteraceae bacterium]
MTGLDLEALGDLRVAVTALVGRTTASIGEVLNYAPGTIVPLDAKAEAPVPLLVNGIAIATGDLVALEDGSLAIHINEILQFDNTRARA